MTIAHTELLSQPGELQPVFGKRSRVVIAISDRQARNRVASALRSEGCVVVAVHDGYHLIQGMADAILNSTVDLRPDLIIADSILPGCTGLSLLAGLRALKWPTPVILLTEVTDRQARAKAVQLHAAAVIAKPADLEEVREAVRRALS